MLLVDGSKLVKLTNQNGDRLLSEEGHEQEEEAPVEARCSWFSSCTGRRAGGGVSLFSNPCFSQGTCLSTDLMPSSLVAACRPVSKAYGLGVNSLQKKIGLGVKHFTPG